MTLRAIDGLRVDLSGDLNEGLDALEKRPTLAIRGPFSKTRVGTLMPTHVLLRDRKDYAAGELWREVGPYRDLYGPVCWIPCPGMHTGYWKIQSSSVEQIWWFRTPPEFRPPVYRSLEQLEEQALKNYERKVERRIAAWQYDVENQFDKFWKWKLTKLRNLDRAMTRIRQKRHATAADLRKLADIQKKYREVLQKEFVNRLPFNHEEFAEYQAKYLDVWEHRYACENRRWLATPPRVCLLPVWHLKVQSGWAVAKLSQSIEDVVISPPHWHGEGQTFIKSKTEVSDWKDISLQAPVGLFEKEIQYDRDRFLDAVNEMLPKVKPATNMVVTAVELRQFGNLFSEAKTILKELKKAVELTSKHAKHFRDLIKAGSVLNRVFDGKASAIIDFLSSKEMQAVRKDTLLSVKGCREASKLLSCRHLAWRFGDPDSVRALTDLWNVFHEDFERLMSPLYHALASAGNVASRHRTILDVTESHETEIKCEDLFYDDEADADDQEVSDVKEAWQLAPTAPILRIVSQSKRQTATLLTRDVLTDSFGNEVGVDEATTRYIMDLIGLNFNPKTIWDLTPYTFVVDWFLNIGQILEDYCSVSNLRFRSTIYGGCVSEKFVYTATHVKSGGVHSEGETELWHDSDGTRECVRAFNDVDVLGKPLVARVYRRNPVPASVLEQGRLRFHWDDYLFKGIGASQMLCGVELLMQRIIH